MGRDLVPVALSRLAKSKQRPHICFAGGSKQHYCHDQSAGLVQPKQDLGE